jgi:hypothetical protein
MRIAAEDAAGAGAALLRRTHARLASGAVCIAGIDQRNTELMLAAFQVALSDDQGRGDHLVAGEHGCGGCRLIGHCARKVRFPAGFDAGAHGGKREAARYLLVVKRSVERSRGVSRRCFSHCPLLYQENERLFITPGRRSLRLKDNHE